MTHTCKVTRIHEEVADEAAAERKCLGCGFCQHEAERTGHES